MEFSTQTLAKPTATTLIIMLFFNSAACQEAVKPSAPTNEYPHSVRNNRMYYECIRDIIPVKEEGDNRFAFYQNRNMFNLKSDQPQIIINRELTLSNGSRLIRCNIFNNEVLTSAVIIQSDKTYFYSGYYLIKNCAESLRLNISKEDYKSLLSILLDVPIACIQQLDEATYIENCESNLVYSFDENKFKFAPDILNVKHIDTIFKEIIKSYPRIDLPRKIKLKLASNYLQTYIGGSDVLYKLLIKKDCSLSNHLSGDYDIAIETIANMITIDILVGNYRTEEEYRPRVYLLTYPSRKNNSDVNDLSNEANNLYEKFINSLSPTHRIKSTLTIDESVGKIYFLNGEGLILNPNPKQFLTRRFRNRVHTSWPKNMVKNYAHSIYNYLDLKNIEIEDIEVSRKGFKIRAYSNGLATHVTLSGDLLYPYAYKYSTNE